MRKKFIFPLLALTLALTACGQAAEGTESEPSVSTEISQETEGVETTESSESEETIESTEEEIKVVSRDWNNQADISWIDPEKPMVAFSFDDGPVSAYAENSTAGRIQKVLADNGMHATFFYWGNSMNGLTKRELKDAYDRGFELGNHTATHPDLTKLTAEEIEEEVAKIDDVLKEITGQEQFLLRPPYLSINQLVKDTINVPLISCGMDSKDWDGATAQQMIDKFVAAAEDGSLDGQIVLMHETYFATAEAMEYLVPYLKEQGWQIVTISELYKVRGQEMKAGRVYTTCK